MCLPALPLMPDHDQWCSCFACCVGHDQAIDKLALAAAEDQLLRVLGQWLVNAQDQLTAANPDPQTCPAKIEAGSGHRPGDRSTAFTTNTIMMPLAQQQQQQQQHQHHLQHQQQQQAQQQQAQQQQHNSEVAGSAHILPFGELKPTSDSAPVAAGQQQDQQSKEGQVTRSLPPPQGCQASRLQNLQHLHQQSHVQSGNVNRCRHQQEQQQAVLQDSHHQHHHHQQQQQQQHERGAEVLVQQQAVLPDSHPPPQQQQLQQHQQQHERGAEVLVQQQHRQNQLGTCNSVGNTDGLVGRPATAGATAGANGFNADMLTADMVGSSVPSDEGGSSANHHQ
jgi:hypothetical protein